MRIAIVGLMDRNRVCVGVVEEDDKMRQCLPEELLVKSRRAMVRD